MANGKKPCFLLFEDLLENLWINRKLVKIRLFYVNLPYFTNEELKFFLGNCVKLRKIWLKFNHCNSRANLIISKEKF